MNTETKVLTDRCQELILFLEKYPNLPTPSKVEFLQDQVEVVWYFFSDKSLTKQKEDAQRIVRMLPGKVDKVPLSDLFQFKGQTDGINWRVTVDRPSVCERVVVSSETITKMVTDPDAELIEVTEVLETVEWICSPLLDDTTVSS